MTCEAARVLLPAYLDDELDPADCAAITAHLVHCAECRRESERAEALRSVLQGADLSAQPSGDFERQLARALRAEASVRRFPVMQWRAAAAALILCIAGLAGAMRLWNRPNTEQLAARDVVASHIRSLQAGHMIDVVSSDRHTVKPWFQGRLDFAPPVPDLADLGWTLTGGRLDYAAGRPVAAVVYRRAAHPINVFIWPAAGEKGTSVETDQGYTVLHWTRGGMTWWVVSDLNAADLQEFGRALQSRQ